MNILLGISKYPPDFTGAGLRLHNMYQRLKTKDITEVYVITNWEKPSSRYINELNGIHVIRIGEYTEKKKFEKYGKLLKRFAIPLNISKSAMYFYRLHKKIDIVHTVGGGWLPSAIGWFAFLLKKPLVKEIVCLGIDDPESIVKNKTFFIRWFFMYLFRYAKLVVTLSPELRKSCLRYGMPEHKMWFRFNPIDFNEIEKSLSAGESDEKMEDTPLLLWVGIIERRKNLEFLLDAACYLTPPARLLFVGPVRDEDYFKELKYIIKNIPKDINVEFLGEIKDRKKLYSLYRRAKIFWFASHKEGAPNVVLESLACGTPVIALPVMNVMQHIITDLNDGEIVQVDDPQYFAKVVNGWLRKSYNSKDMRERAKRRFGAVKIDDEYYRRMKQILNCDRNGKGI